MGSGGGGQGQAGGMVTGQNNTLGFVPGLCGRPAEAWSCWAWNTSHHRVGNGTEEAVPPLQGEETGHLGLLGEEADSASAQIGPSKGRKEEASGVPFVPSQTTGE